jgi:hypothetical protein
MMAYRNATVNDRKRQLKEGWMRAVKFLSKYLAALPNSPPKTNHDKRSRIYNTQANRWREYLDRLLGSMEHKRRNANRSLNGQTTDEKESLWIIAENSQGFNRKFQGSQEPEKSLRTESRINLYYTGARADGHHGFLYRPKSPDISDISCLSVGADKKSSIFFV